MLMKNTEYIFKMVEIKDINKTIRLPNPEKIFAIRPASVSCPFWVIEYEDGKTFVTNAQIWIEAHRKERM